MSADSEQFEYVGFWLRSWAAVCDTIIIMVVVYTMLFAFSSGESLVISWVFPAVATILFWMYAKATPGKMFIAAGVVDARTGDVITFRQGVLRYLGYFISMLPLFLGIFWVAFDPKKQGWHDKIAGTVVVRPASNMANAVRFSQKAVKGQS